MLNDSLFSSDKGDWQTPDEILDPLTRWFRVDTDPCAGRDTQIGCSINYRNTADTGEDDGLIRPWRGTCYVNPPYGRTLSSWVERAELAYRRSDCEVIMLLPARTDTQWWQSCWKADAVCFWKGRIKFVGAENSAPFPSALVYWGDRVSRFNRAFSDYGHVIKL